MTRAVHSTDLAEAVKRAAATFTELAETNWRLRRLDGVGWNEMKWRLRPLDGGRLSATWTTFEVVDYIERAGGEIGKEWTVEWVERWPDTACPGCGLSLPCVECGYEEETITAGVEAEKLRDSKAEEVPAVVWSELSVTDVLVEIVELLTAQNKLIEQMVDALDVVAEDASRRAREEGR